MLILSKDNDFHQFKSRRLIFKHDIAELLEIITEKYDAFQNTQILPIVKQLLNNYHDELIGEINEQIREKLILRTDFERTSNLKIEKLNFLSDKIISIRNDYAEVETLMELNCGMTVHPSEQDIEKDTFEEKYTKHKIIKKVEIPVDLEVHFREDKIVKIKWINSNEPIIMDFFS